MGFDFHVHGLWILGALFFFVASLMAGNLQWVEGTTAVSFAIAIILIFVLFLIASMFWISAAVNARGEELGTRARPREERAEKKNDIVLTVHRDGRVVRVDEKNNA